MPKATLALLALTMLLLAACASPTPTPTNAPPTPTSTASPTPTMVPTATPTHTPAPTATPTQSPAQLLAAVGAVMAIVDTFGFSFDIAIGDSVTYHGTGKWVAGDYSLEVSQPLCPPSAPGVPAPTDCSFVVTYKEVTVDGQAQRQFGGASRLEEFGVEFLEDESSAIAHLLDALSAAEVTVTNTMVDDTMAYQIEAPDGIRLIVERGTKLPVAASYERDDETVRSFSWAFYDHDQPMSLTTY